MVQLKVIKKVKVYVSGRNNSKMSHCLSTDISPVTSSSMCAETIRIPLLVCSYSTLPQGGTIIIGKTGMIMDMAVGGWFVMPNNV